MKPDKENIKQYLQTELVRNKIFWSYKDVSPEQIDDDLLIEKVLFYLDLDDINKLFTVFPYREVKKIWMKSQFIRDPMNRSLNLLLAFLYFNIKKPEKYVNEVMIDHLHSLD